MGSEGWGGQCTGEIMKISSFLISLHLVITMEFVFLPKQWLYQGINNLTSLDIQAPPAWGILF